MKTAGNTVLITGGATGIGFCLAKLLLEQGNEVIICGRREDKLRDARAGLPGLHIKVCDVADPAERVALYHWVKNGFGGFNILVNNAGIQKMLDFKQGADVFSGGESEIETNLTAPVHLCALFVPLLLGKDAAIINISSGLAFKPVPHTPVYGATKAAIHIFSMSLRMQLKDTSIRVFEIVPPIVETGLDRGSREHRQANLPAALAPEAVAAATLQAMAKDEYEIVIGKAAGLVLGGKEHLEEMARHHIDPD